MSLYTELATVTVRYRDGSSWRGRVWAISAALDVGFLPKMLSAGWVSVDVILDQGEGLSEHPPVSQKGERNGVHLRSGKG